MAKLDGQLREDRALRDAARRLVEADLGFVKGDVQDRSVGKRTADLVGSESRNVAEQALSKAKAHPEIVIGSIAALLLVLFRNPLLDLILDFLEDDDDQHSSDPEDEQFLHQTEPAEPQDRSQPNRAD